MKSSVKSEKPLRNPLFVLGYPRSGTTLLRALIGSHSKIRLLHEPELIRGIRSAGIPISERIKRENYPQMLEQLQNVSVCRRHLSTLSEEKLAELINHPKDLSSKEIYEFLLPKPEDVEVWGEKSLSNVFYIQELHKLYPNAIFVHIIRDPRAALLSHYRKKFAGSVDCSPVLGRKDIRFFAQSSIRWKYWLDAVDSARDLLGKSVIVRVRYKDIVREPKKNLKQICAKIGVEFEPEMMKESQRKDDPVMSSSGIYGTYAHQNLIKSINPKRADAGKELPKWASYIIEKYVGDDLKDLGYNLRKERITITEKIRIKTELLLSEKKINLQVKEQINSRKGVSGDFSKNWISTQKVILGIQYSAAATTLWYLSENCQFF